MVTDFTDSKFEILGGFSGHPINLFLHANQTFATDKITHQIHNHDF